MFPTSDTRVLLCSTDGGKVFRMTQDHHADARGEAARLRRMGTSRLIMDSYGETRWMGALANTRGYANGLLLATMHLINAPLRTILYLIFYHYTESAT